VTWAKVGTSMRRPMGDAEMIAQGWTPAMVALPLPGRDVLVWFRSGECVVRHLQTFEYWIDGEAHLDCGWYPDGGQVAAADGGSWSYWRELPAFMCRR
jgi:hypothetical protein